MTPEPARMPAPPEDRTIILPIGQEEYTQIVPPKIRVWIDQHYRLHPELFPSSFKGTYTFHDDKTSKKTGVRTRRIKFHNGQVWTVHPSFVMPHMTGFTKEVSKALYARKYGMPYEGLVYLFGKDENYWYRLETRFGRKSIVGTTVKTVPIPKDLLADEHHEKINGEKIYLATTGGAGVVLGAEAVPSASTEDLQKG